MNIAGKWIGFYEYGLGHTPPLFGERVQFRMNIISGDDSFVGEIKESSSDYSIDETARLKGFVEDGLVSFVKTYKNRHQFLEDGSSMEVVEGEELEVRYTGEYSEKYDCMFGVWEIEDSFEEEGEEFYTITQGIWKVTREK